jgi:DNA polymerase I-like protein with 3'-5' exonuclease and polymerase domains/predicted P-loop ATPase
MNAADISIESVAKAVGGKIERDGSILCNCPIHEAEGTHNPSLVLTITRTGRILVHCRSQNCDAKHFQKIADHLVKVCELPRSHVGGKRTDEEVRYVYQHPDGSYCWTKTRFYTRAGKKRFICEWLDMKTKQWVTGRPAGAPLLFNLPTIASALAAYPNVPLLVVEGEKDVMTAGELGMLAVTNADGAGKWRTEDTRTLIDLGARRIIICPDNDAPGISHGIAVARTFQQAGIETRWLELPELGVKEDLSDWVPNQTHPDARLKELVEAAPPFDAEALDWRSRLKMARPSAGCTYRGDIPNLKLALQFEQRLKGCFAWNEFRLRDEVTRKTPWCQPEWWAPENLTPVGYRARCDADLTELGSYLTHTYDFGASSVSACRNALNTEGVHNSFDEIKDWFGERPRWEGGNSILDTWLIDYAGADTTVHSREYLALVGRMYVMQVVNRALNPGAKADYSLVFVGLQGAGKDQVLDAMFSPYYREGIPSPRVSQADFALALAGGIVAHAAEMSAWRKADVEDQKAVLTRRVDHGRRAWGYDPRTYPRRSCLAFSTNDAECLVDTTGDRRYWNVAIIRARVDIEGLRRVRDQILAEALVRLKAGERHWPTPEEEERIIAPERAKNMPEAALEILAVLERYITEEPLMTRPNKGSLPWRWQKRPQPLTELHIDAFFEQCFGMYAAVPRRGLDRASKRDIAYCTTWLRQHDWKRVEKRLPDGQRVVVWRSSDGWQQGPGSGGPNAGLGSAFGSALAQEGPQEASRADVAGGTNVAGAEEEVPECGSNASGEEFRRTQPTQHDPRKSLGSAQETGCAQSFLLLGGPNRPNLVNTLITNEKTFLNSENLFRHKIVGGKIGLGPPAFERLSPATLDDLEGMFPCDRFLALDVETTGLRAGHDCLRTVQFSDGVSVAIVVFDRPVPARALVVLAEFLRDRRMVAHNGRFEGSWFHEAGLEIVLDDTALLFAAVRGTRAPKGDKRTRGGRVSLAALAAMVLGETLDKSEQTSDWSAPELSPSQLSYALNDAIKTHRIWEALRAELHRKSQLHGVDIAAGYEDLRVSAAMAHAMERHGIGFDLEAHRAWMARKQAPVGCLEAHLAKLDPALTPSCIASGVQLDRFFQKRLESYPDRDRRRVLMAWPKTDKTRRLACGREELATVIRAGRLLPAEQQLVDALYARADTVRGLSTFGEAFSTHVVNGRLHGQLHAGGAVTGRYTSTDPNLQNIPTESEFRGFFRAPPGRRHVDVDYSQLELRVFAGLSNDTKMIAAFEDGWDYHALIMERVGCTRRQAKAINFGIIFGMGVATLASDLGVDDVTAGEYLLTWNEQAPVGAEWRAERPGLYIAEQGLRTARRWIDYLDDADAEISAGTRPMNYPVQGGAADVMHRAMRLLFERYRDWPGSVLPVLSIHDEIIVEADAAEAEQVGSLLSEVMVEAFRDVLPNGPTRFLAIPGIGTTWAEAKADGERREKALRQSFSSR